MDMVHDLPGHVSPDVVFDFDIYYDSRFDIDVHASYAEALKDAPDIFWTPKNGGHWMVKRYDLMTAIVQEPEIFSAREMQIPRMPKPYILIPLNMDPPENTPFRHAMMPRFSPKAVRELEHRMRHWAEVIVGDIAARGECEFMADVASLYPVSIFMELMGMDLSRLRECRDLADDFFRARTPQLFESAIAAIMGLLQGVIDERKANPDNGLVSFLLAADLGEGRRFTDDEMMRTCFLLFLGGMDTVTNVTGFSFQQLAGMPALQKRLAENPALIPKFVEEGLRCFGVSSTPRMVTKDCERFGLQFRAGEMVLCILPIAGRDDRVNANPQEFSVDRDQQPHLTFSSGPHLCIGHLLARMEMRFLTEEWVRRIPAFTIPEGAERRFRAGTVLALENLPLQWNVAAG